MRFRTSIANTAPLTRLVESVGKLAKRAIFRFTPDKLSIVVAVGTEGVQVWAHINVDDVFTNYKIESNAGNEIALELTTAAFNTALKSSTNAATDVVLRLAKKGRQPVLSLAVKTTSLHGEEYEVTQDIVVRVLKPSDIANLKEPLCPEPDVHIQLPPLLQVRSVAERMKALAPVCRVRANRASEFRIGVQSAHAKVETEWRNLKHPELQATQASQARATQVRPEDFHEVHVRSKALAALLSAYAIGGTSIVCICADFAAIFYLYLGNAEAPSGIVTAFLPAIHEDGED